MSLFFENIDSVIVIVSSMRMLTKRSFMSYVISLSFRLFLDMLDRWLVCGIGNIVMIVKCKLFVKYSY